MTLLGTKGMDVRASLATYNNDKVRPSSISTRLKVATKDDIHLMFYSYKY